MRRSATWAAGASLLAGLLGGAPLAAAASEHTAGDRFAFNGDFRYRHEIISQQGAKRRDRDRLRVRAGVTARVNDTVQAELALATDEGGDPRSSNVTLGGAGARKDVKLDLAVVQWQPLDSLTLLGGKMKYPWQRAGESVLFDGDVNPEGIAAQWQQGAFFASAFHHYIAERSDAAESTLRGTQFGWKPSVGEGRLTIAAGWFDFRRVRGFDPFHDDANGNSTTDTGCAAGVALCLAQDYNLVEGLVEFTHPVAGRPLQLFADYFANVAADNREDEAFSAGFLYGRADKSRSWEIAYSYQRVRKDALFGQFIDSDVGAGNTDHRAHVIQAGYAPAKNWTVNLTWQFADTDLAVPAVIDGVPVRGRNYERLHLDLNFNF